MRTPLIRFAIVAGVLLIAACSESTQKADTGISHDSVQTTDNGTSADTTLGADLTSVDTNPSLGNLTVSWTVDGNDDAHESRCQQYGITFWSVLVFAGTDITVPTEHSLGVDCVNGVWKSVDSFHELPVGEYTVQLAAHSGQPFTGPIITSTTKTITLASLPAETQLTFSFVSGAFDL